MKFLFPMLAMTPIILGAKPSAHGKSPHIKAFAITFDSSRVIATSCPPATYDTLLKAPKHQAFQFDDNHNVIGGTICAGAEVTPVDLSAFKSRLTQILNEQFFKEPPGALQNFILETSFDVLTGRASSPEYDKQVINKLISGGLSDTNAAKRRLDFVRNKVDFNFHKFSSAMIQAMELRQDSQLEPIPNSPTSPEEVTRAEISIPFGKYIATPELVLTAPVSAGALAFDITGSGCEHINLNFVAVGAERLKLTALDKIDARSFANRDGNKNFNRIQLGLTQTQRPAMNCTVVVRNQEPVKHINTAASNCIESNEWTSISAAEAHWGGQEWRSYSLGSSCVRFARVLVEKDCQGMRVDRFTIDSGVTKSAGESTQDGKFSYVADFTGARTQVNELAFHISDFKSIRQSRCELTLQVK